jgi:hypothetical protein
MKTKIFKIAAILLVLAGVFYSCKKNEGILQPGIYSEISPFEGSTQIEVLNEERLIIVNTYIEMRDEFIYHIINNTIELTSIDDNYYYNLYFRIVNDCKFEIGYLYASSPSGPPPPPMIFKKQTSLANQTN